MAWSSRIPKIISESEARVAAAVHKTGLDIEAGAKQRTPPRVDTGAMMNGWSWTPAGPFEGTVTNAVEYAVWHEFGTVHMAAHPMLIPAAEEARDGFIKAVAAAYK